MSLILLFPQEQCGLPVSRLVPQLRLTAACPLLLENLDSFLPPFLSRSPLSLFALRLRQPFDRVTVERTCLRGFEIRTNLFSFCREKNEEEEGKREDFYPRDVVYSIFPNNYGGRIMVKACGKRRADYSRGEGD